MAERTQSAEFEWCVVLDGQKSQVTQTDDGDLIIEGYAADYQTDRDDELFEEGSLDAGIKAFMDSNPVLLYHHKKALALGQVLDYRKDQKGMWVKARVDKPEPGTFAADVFRKVARGTIRGFSFGGKFFRRFGPDGPRIFKADIHELSITPQPVNPRTLFAVGAKAFDELDDELAGVPAEGGEADDKALAESVTRLEALFDRIDAANVTRPGKVSE